VNRVFNFTIKEYNNFEAGEGKSQLDSHFAHISHKIVRWVRLGNDLESGEQVAELIKSMKNATCKKLLIDRSKATKVGTLKDISLFGSFTFPTEGQFVNGLQMRPLAGTGNVSSKSKEQISQLAGRRIPVAGATGAVTSEEQPAAEPIQCPTPFPGTRSEGYAVRFIQHAPEQPVVSSLHPIMDDQYLSQRLDSGYALKHGPGKRTVFSQAQKDIMIEFYNRQAVNRIRAEPKDVMKAMKDAGLEVLSVAQIKNWWSTYHRKNRALLVNGQQAANLPSNVTPASVTSSTTSVTVPSSTRSATVTSSVMTATVTSSVTSATVLSIATSDTVTSSVTPATVISSVTSATVPSSVMSATLPSSVTPATVTSSVTPATVPSSVTPATLLSSVTPAPVMSTVTSPTVPSRTAPATVLSIALPPTLLSTSTATHLSSALSTPVSSSAPPAVSSTATVLSPAISQAILTGSLSQLSGAVTEWFFPEDFSQSTIDGRNGSNACAFISLYFGQVASKGLLPPRQGLQLNAYWKDVLRQAIIRGNDLHDELFDHEGIDLHVDDAVEIAGEDCGVLCLGQQKDLFGGTVVAKQLLANFLDELSGKKERICLVFCSSGRTMFLLVDSCGHFYFVDSHSHRNSGAIIASAPPGHAKAFTDWIDRMMDLHWQTPLRLGQ